MVYTTAISLCSWWAYESTEDEHCSHHIRDQLMHKQRDWIFSVLVIGLVNNSITMAVFFQPKYKERILPLMLRFFACFNFTVLFSFFLLQLHGNMDHDHHEVNVMSVPLIFVIAVSQDMTYAMLFLMSVVRLLFVAHPFLMAMCNHSKPLLVSLVTFWLGYRSAVNAMFIPSIIHTEKMPAKQSENQAIYFIILHAVSMTLNFSTYLVNKYRQKSQGKKDNIKKFAAGGMTIMYKYQVISSLVCLVTVLPYSIVVLLPVAVGREDLCQYCEWYVQLYQNLEGLFLVNYQIENILYGALSKQYRQEVKTVFTKLAKKCRLPTYKR